VIFYNSYRNSQQDATVYQNLLFHVCMKLKMFRATHRPSSGGSWTLSLLDAIQQEVVGCCDCWTLSSNLSVQQPFTYAKPEAASAVWNS